VAGATTMVVAVAVALAVAMAMFALNQEQSLL
jgi:hypothetical protein